MFQEVELKILYFGTPVVLISTLNEDGSPNIGPMSSAWALGNSVMLGLGTDGKTYENLTQRRECVLNFPSEDMAAAVERLAPLTGKFPVPADKAERYRYEKDKFGAAGLTPAPSAVVGPPRIAECPLQFEAVFRAAHRVGGDDAGIAAVEVEVMRMHAREDLLIDATHIAPGRWKPLIYNFRHYFGLAQQRDDEAEATFTGLGEELGKTFKSET